VLVSEDGDHQGQLPACPLSCQWLKPPAYGRASWFRQVQGQRQRAKWKSASKKMQQKIQEELETSANEKM